VIIRGMKTVTLEEARTEFARLFEIAARGETVIIQGKDQRVVLQSVAGSREPSVAPPDYFAHDYSGEEIGELNRLASQAPGGTLV